MAYIALKPVRFSKNYAIDELIPDNEVSPAMEKNLIAMGMIAKVSENPQNPSENAPNLNEPNAGDKEPANGEGGENGQNIAAPDEGSGDDIGADESPPNDEENSEPEPVRKNRKK